MANIQDGILIGHPAQPKYANGRMQLRVIDKAKRTILQMATGSLFLAPVVARAMDFATFSNACAQNGYGAAIIGGVYKCIARTGGGGAQPNYNFLYQQQQAAAAQRQAAAEEQRRKDAEFEQQRIDADNKRRMEEIANQAKFIDDRNRAASVLRGSTDNTAAVGLGNSGLRGNTATTELRGLKLDLRPAPNSDSRVVDARNASTGLPKSIEDEIPHTPSGDRVRKGFEAAMNHDWSAAHAWFQDALNHDSGNTGIERLIDLAQFTMQYEKTRLHQLASSDKLAADSTAKNTTATKNTTVTYGRRVDAIMNPDLAKALDDFNRIYLPKHPVLWGSVKSSDSAQQTKSADRANGITVTEPSAKRNSNWKLFFDAIFTKPRMKHVPVSAAAVRG